MQQWEMRVHRTSCRCLLGRDFRRKSTTQQGIVAFASSLLVKPQATNSKSSAKIQRGKFWSFESPCGENSVCWADSFPYFTERLCPAAFPTPRQRTSPERISVKWSPLRPVEPSVLPALCVPLAFSLRSLACLAVSVGMLCCVLHSRK